MEAVRGNHVAIAKLLIDKNADVNKANKVIQLRRQELQQQYDLFVFVVARNNPVDDCL